MNPKANVACNFNCLMKTALTSQDNRQSRNVHCKCRNISKKVQDRDVFTTDNEYEVHMIC